MNTLSFATKMRRFGRDTEGSVAVIAATAFLPVLLMTGVAVDFGRTNQARQELQQSLDAALLQGLNNKSNPVAAAQASFTKQTSMTSLQNAQATFQATPDGKGLTANATAQTTLMFGGLSGSSNVTIKAHSGGVYINAFTPQNATFSVGGASGMYWKQVDLHTVDATSKADTTVATFYYQMTNSSTYTGVSSGDVGKQIDLGSNYNDVYMAMTVYTDGCGPGMVPDPRNSGSSFACVAQGSSYTTTQKQCTGSYRNQTCQNVQVTAYAPQKSSSAGPTTYYTNVASAHPQLFIGVKNGNQGVTELPANQKPDIFTFMPCGGGTSNNVGYAWEDTPYSAGSNYPGYGTWTTQDFIFNVAVTCSNNNPNYPNNTGKLTN
ncbi:MAG: Tad domain-containing protein [Hyphomicrobiales bacterium]|nr:Tad domain-containing protein [Hyphomicrobiales bacterium]